MLLLCVAGGGEAGAGAPAVGISPASAETDKTHVRINAKPILFTGVFSYLRITGILGIGRYQYSGIGELKALRSS